MKFKKMKFPTLLVFIYIIAADFSNAQFPFRLPSPPRILFGGFRPFFERRPRPSLQPSSLRPFQQQILSQRPPQQVLSQIPQRPPDEGTILRPPPPFPESFPPQINQPAPPGPPVVPPTPSISAPRPPPLVNPNQPPGSSSFSIAQPISTGFGSPKPETLLNGVRPVASFPQPTGGQFIEGSNDLGTGQLSSGISHNNNIIGMLPPPLPDVKQQFGTTPRPLATARPVVSTTKVSNSLEDLLVNPVPLVNAGVLPLANEEPAQLQFFPPLTRPTRSITKIT